MGCYLPKYTKWGNEASSVTFLYVVALQKWCDTSIDSLRAWQDENMPCLPKGSEQK